MDTKHIVALEIGSSKIKGLAASVGELGDIQVIAIEEIRVNDCVRYGKIQNVQEVSAHVNDIIRKLENNPQIAPRKITDIFVSLGGRSLATVMAQAQAKFPNAVEITAETIDRLKRDASFGLVTDKTNLGMLPHAFFVDNSEVKNIVGTVGTHIRAEFSTIVISPVICRNLELIKFDDHSLRLINIVRPIALADLVLTSSERQLGCALVDCGAETTTITIYKDDALQSIITLPIGSRNITRDLMSGLSMTEESAEMAKARSGSAMSSDTTNSTDIEVNNYISARAGEIVANILHQIEVAGFKSQSLPAGIILTGGGARLRNFDRLIENQSKMPVRMAAIDSSLKFKGSNLDRNANIDILAIAKYAADNFEVNCLTAIPDPVVEKHVSETLSETDYNNYEHQNTRRPYVDEDSLLEDDKDDVDTVGTPAVHIRKSEKNIKNDRPRDEDYDNNYDYGDDEHPGKSGGTLIGGLKRRLAKFWNDPHDDDEDDLDAPAE